MKSRRKLKYRELPSKYNKVEDLEKKVEKAIQKANERIKSVSRKYKGTTYMWAVNKLRSKVGNKYFRNNRIVLPKNVKETELIKLYKEIESFMKSKESTKTGIKEIQEKSKETIRTELLGDDITDLDIDAMYSMLEYKEFTSLLNKDFNASEFWVIMNDSRKANENREEFIQRVVDYITEFQDSPDEEIRRKAKYLYDEFLRD